MLKNKPVVLYGLILFVISIEVCSCVKQKAAGSIEVTTVAEEITKGRVVEYKDLWFRDVQDGFILDMDCDYKVFENRYGPPKNSRIKEVYDIITGEKIIDAAVATCEWEGLTVEFIREHVVSISVTSARFRLADEITVGAARQKVVDLLGDTPYANEKRIDYEVLTQFELQGQCGLSFDLSQGLVSEIIISRE